MYMTPVSINDTLEDRFEDEALDRVETKIIATLGCLGRVDGK